MCLIIFILLSKPLDSIYPQVIKKIYIYFLREFHERAYVNYHDNYTVTFYQNRTWKYVPELSNGSLSDVVTVLNTPLVVSIHIHKFSS